jgi:YVTN family beta-propeller protein
VVYAVNDNDDNVSVIDTASRQVTGAPIAVGGKPVNAVVSPDGKTLYVDNEKTDSVSVIDTATRQVTGEIPVGDEPWGMGLSPDGTRLYVTNYGDENVSVIDTATRQVTGAPIPVGDQPYELAVTPDGKSVYVANYGEEDSVTVINTQTRQASNIPVPGGPWQVAIVPDQSPTALFTAAATKSKPLNYFFSGASSSDPDGAIAGFNWNFGDGTTLPSGGPVPTHSYAKAGTYPVGLTVTDNEGCSVNMVFTGRTAYCSGSAAATQLQSLTVKAPNNFKFGKLKRNPRNGTAKLTVKVPAAGKLILAGKKAKRAQRKAKKAGKVTLNIRPKPKTKKQLAAKGDVKVRVKVTFRPTGGDARTKSKSLKLILR